MTMVRCQNITFLTDTGVYGPPLEIAHAYYDQWPTGNQEVTPSLIETYKLQKVHTADITAKALPCRVRGACSPITQEVGDSLSLSEPKVGILGNVDIDP